jgi:hypothetical protein
MTKILDAFELVCHAIELLPRIDAALAEIARRPDLEEEKAWLAAGRERLARAREGIDDLPIRALRLPEIVPIRGERARALQAGAVDALERVHAGIALAGGARSPLLEVLAGSMKPPMLRKCSRDDFEAFVADFERRAASSYARRMVAQEEYAVVLPAIEGFRAAVATWRMVFSDEPLAEETADALREELERVALRLDVPCRQARLLAQAALAGLKEIADAHQVAQKPKRRTKAEGDPDTHALLENDPPDPAEPTSDERAELEGL